MRKVMSIFHFIFLLFAFAGALIIERPKKIAYVLLIVLSIISHIAAVLVIIAVLCYAYRRNLHAVRRAR